MVIDPQMATRIQYALSCATDQEIHDGMSFYPGAYGLCRFFARIYNTSVESVAGIYAAPSPMNTWETNVSNILDVLRWKERGSRQTVLPRVNTSNINRDKALLIALGHRPLDVLSGHKVRSFYLAIAFPDEASHMVIDRHLINLALGVFPNKKDQSRLASNKLITSTVSDTYKFLGEQEGIGNRLASIAWFVQRRIERTGQIALPVK